jgi:hypothetical protein
MRRAVARAFVALALAAVACSRSSGGENVVPSGEAMLRVDNQDVMDMNVYVIRSEQRVRLGTVPGLSQRVLKIPPALLGAGGSLQFLADPIGGTHTPVSEVMYVQPGEVVELVIPPQRPYDR